MLRANGEDIKVQQELMRHADVRTTMNLYTQALSSQKRAAQEKIVQMVLTEGAVPLPCKRLQNTESNSTEMVGAIGFEPMTSTV